MDHGIQAANQDLAKNIRNLYRDIEEMLHRLLMNIDIIADHKDMVRHFLMTEQIETWGRLLVTLVKDTKIIERLLKVLKEDLKAIKEMGASTSDISKFKETCLESNKTMKVVEEMSHIISEILEKMDQPASLLELFLERVQGLGFIQEGASLEQLPDTLKTQVEHWSTTRDSKIREKMGFLVQAVGS